MLKSLAKVAVARRSARYVPGGGWITLLAMSPRARAAGLFAVRRGWQEVQKRRSR